MVHYFKIKIFSLDIINFIHFTANVYKYLLNETPNFHYRFLLIKLSK